MGSIAETRGAFSPHRNEGNFSGRKSLIGITLGVSAIGAISASNADSFTPDSYQVQNEHVLQINALTPPSSTMNELVTRAFRESVLRTSHFSPASASEQSQACGGSVVISKAEYDARKAMAGNTTQIWELTNMTTLTQYDPNLQKTTTTRVRDASVYNMSIPCPTPVKKELSSLDTRQKIEEGQGK